MRVHRAVVLPDFQGVGIGTAVLNYIAQYITQGGRRVTICTSNPAMICTLKKSNKWCATRCSRESSGSSNGLIQNKFKKGSTSCARITASFEYIKQ